MSSTLNIRNIGEDRKSALEAEAKRRGQSVAEVVRACIDDSLDRARREREKAEWMEAAKAGFAEEERQYQMNGPILRRYYPFGRE